MRVLKFLFVGAIALSVLWACSDDDEITPDPGPYPNPGVLDEEYYAENATISSDNGSFSSTEEGGGISLNDEGGEVVVNVDCGVEWTVDVVYSRADDWLETVVDCEAGTLTLTAEQNTVETERSATVTLMTAESGIEFAEISVTQKAYGACYITVETNEWHVAASGDDLTTEIAVEANADWEAECTAEWLTAEKTDAGVKLTASENQTTEERTAEVVLTCTDGVSTDEATITVTQDGHDACTISVEASEWNAPAVGALTTEIAVEANADWEAECTAEWLTAEKTDAGLKLTASENEETEERTAEVVLTCTDGISSDSATVTVTQDAHAYVTLSEETLSFSETVGTGSVTVSSNYSWTQSTTEDWIIVTVNGQNLLVTVSANESEEAREGVVTVSAGDGAENVAEAELTVSQSGKDVSAIIFVYTITSGSTQIRLPLSGTVNCTVDWGDGNVESVTSSNPTHTYAAAGEFDVSVSGTVTALKQYSGYSKDNGDKWLTSVKQWGKTGLTSMEKAFQYSGVEYLPESTGDSFAEVTTFEYAFSRCESLVSVPAGTFENCPLATSFDSTFEYCDGLKNVDSKFTGCTGVKDFSYLFYWCSALETIPEGMFVGCSKVENFRYIFYKCEKLTSAPVDMFDGCVSVTNFSSAFYQCYALTGESPYSVIDGEKVHLYERSDHTDVFAKPSSTSKCFTSCTGLTDYDDIPSGWK